MTHSHANPESLGLDSFGADTGVLTVFSQSLPQVEIGNVFWISAIPNGAVRGRHAHYYATQYLIALAGVLDIAVSDPHHQNWHYRLVPASSCVMIPPRHWVEITSLESASSLLVIADRPYYENDYIRSWEDFFSGNFPEHQC